MVDETSPLVSKPAITNTYNSVCDGNTHAHDCNGKRCHVGYNQAHNDIEQPAVADRKIALAPIIIPMSIGIFLVALDGTIVLSTYAAIGSELNQLQNTSWIVTGYMLTLTSFQPLYGKLSDIFGRKYCLLFAYLMFAMGNLFCAVARDMNELIAARAFAGIGGGGMRTMVSIIISDIVPLRSRGTWQGLHNMVYAVGSVTGAPLGGILADSIGWRWAFLFQFPATLVAFIAVSAALVLPKEQNSDLKTGLKRVDFKGAVTLILTVFFFMFGLDRGGNTAWNDRITITLLVAAFIMFLAFATIELRFATEPVAPKRIVTNRSLFACYMANFLGMASSLSMLFHVSLYLQAVEGLKPSEAGLWLLPSILGGVSGSIAGGLMVQKTGKYYYVTLLGYLVFVGGLMTIVLSSGVLLRSFVGIAIGLVVAQLGSNSGVTTSLVALIANAGSEDQAIATAVSHLFRSLGSVVGLSAGSALLQDSLGRSLKSRLSGQDVNELIRCVRESLTYIDKLDPVTKLIVVQSYGKAVHVTLWASVVIAMCAALACLCIKEKPLGRR